MSLATGTAAALCLLASAQLGPENPSPKPDGAALGAEIDLLPTILSAADGKFGGSMNVWGGYESFRLRVVGSQIYFPSGFLTPSGFDNRQLTVAAGVVDYFFMPGFQGPWLGTGLEYWWNTIGSPAGPETASWNSWVYTLGGGFVWKVWNNLYLNPWAAGHLLLSKPQVTLYGATWTPGPFAGEVSLKIGWFAWF